MSMHCHDTETTAPDWPGPATSARSATPEASGGVGRAGCGALSQPTDEIAPPRTSAVRAAARIDFPNVDM
jgi:hypothetical protein